MRKKKLKIELNEKFRQALDLMENSDKNIFLTGRAGTGKSTLLNYFRQTTGKKIVVLASTGVAAVNIAGQTVHSFFGFKPDITLSKVKRHPDPDEIYQKLDAIVIDEISMVRADLLDCVDKFLRLNGPEHKKPFGGIQMIFIGDLYQLPPVVTSSEKEIFKTHYDTPYFFSAKVMQSGFTMEMIELEKIYRQTDWFFINLLNSIRNNTAGQPELKVINSKYQPDFEPPADDYFVYLTTTNDLAKQINQGQLDKLNGEEYFFDARINGRFADKDAPTDKFLTFKIGSQIMLLNNDAQKRWVNGTIGKIVDVVEDEDYNDPLFRKILIELNDGEIVEVGPHTWDIYRFSFDKKSRQINSESVGSFTQLPFKLAWAITIHKSQGKTFDKVILDIGRGTFTSGQLYVALSRCTKLDGLILKKQIRKQNIWIDYHVVKFVTSFQYDKSESELPLEEKISLIQNAIDSEAKLEITYLKSNDEKSARVIIPHAIGEMEYQEKKFIGVSGYCLTRKEERTFRVDRILTLKIIA
jgi:ATP-dependent DNA helicase PIF1